MALVSSVICTVSFYLMRLSDVVVDVISFTTNIFFLMALVLQN